MKRPSLTLFVIALAARIAIIALALYGQGTDERGALAIHLQTSDAPSYVAVARTLITSVRDENEWHERVFLGWPLTLVLPGAVFGYEVACLVLAAILAALVPVVFWQLTRHREASIALAVLTPTWLLHSSNGMSEPAFLLYQLTAIWVMMRARTAATASLGSVLAAASMVVRPSGVFVWVGLAYTLLRRRAWPKLGVHGLIAAASVVLVLALNQHFYGDALRQLHLYGDLPNIGAGAQAAIARLPGPQGHFGLPLLHLIATPLILPVPLWKTVYIWAHALVVLGVCALGIRQLRALDLRRVRGAGAALEARDVELFAMMLVWALGNTVFILCTGPYWGFYSFDRYCVWALPAYLYLAREHLPRRTGAWIALGGFSLALVLWSQAR